MRDGNRHMYEKMFFFYQSAVWSLNLLKGNFTPNSKYIFFLSPVPVFMHLDRFGVSCRFFKDFCLLLNIMEAAGTWIGALNTEFITWLLKLIYGPCCEQFHRNYFLSISLCRRKHASSKGQETSLQS